MVSACLIGINCRYDGKIVVGLECRQELARLNAIWIPFCPEQLGGLPTPRPAAKIINGNGNDVLAREARVIDITGVDVTESFTNGAEQVLAIARQQPISAVFLKSKSPSCGVTSVFGVTAALLAGHGYKLLEFS